MILTYNGKKFSPPLVNHIQIHQSHLSKTLELNSNPKYLIGDDVTTPIYFIFIQTFFFNI